MRQCAAVLAVLLLPGVGWGQIPPEVKVAPGRLAAVSIDTGGKAVAFEVLGDLDAFREYTEDPAKVRLRLIGYTPGVYWLVVATAQDKAAPKIEKCKILVGDAPPVPPPPPPDDPLYLSLKVAWGQCAAAEKGKLPALAAVFVEAEVATRDASLKTTGDLFSVIGKAVRARVGDALAPLRKAAGAHLQAVLPKAADTPLTDALRETARKEHVRVGKLMEALP